MMSLSCISLSCIQCSNIWNIFTLHPHYLMKKEFSTIRYSCTLYPENSIQFSVTPSTLSSSGEWVKVSWQDVKYPNSSDWIGVYSPPANDVYRIDPINHSPIKFQVYTNPFSIPIIHLFVNWFHALVCFSVRSGFWHQSLCNTFMMCCIYVQHIFFLAATAWRLPAAMWPLF